MIVMPGHDDELIKPPNREVSLRIDPKDILLFGEFARLLMFYFLVHIFIILRSHEQIVLTKSYDCLWPTQTAFDSTDVCHKGTIVDKNL